MIAPIGSTVHSDITNPASSATSPAGPVTVRGGGRSSDFEPWREAIRAKLDLGLSAQRIHGDLVAKYNYTGGNYSMRRFVKHLEVKIDLPFRRL